MSQAKCGFKEDYSLKTHQNPIYDRVLKELPEKKNVFVSLPQAAGKTIIALAVLSELVNDNSVKKVLVLLPGRTLVNQWVDKAESMFYGLRLMKNPTLSKQTIEGIRGWLKHSGASGIAMTVQSFRNYVKKEYFNENEFDMVIVDEAADIVLARDFIEGFRMSTFLRGLEKWKLPKIFLLPFNVRQQKLVQLVRKFGKESVLIREDLREAGLTELSYDVPDPILIDDSLVDNFAQVLDDHYRRTRVNVTRLLKKYGIEGYRENLETLLNPSVIERLKTIYHVTPDETEQLQTLISKYILMRHLERWFLYSNREELSRSILASQRDVTKWLSYEDRKLERLAQLVREQLGKPSTKHAGSESKIFIYTQYVATAELIGEYLSTKLSLKIRDIVVVTGKDDDEEQYNKLESFKRTGRILVATPIFKAGTDIPEADAVIVYIPPLSIERLQQAIGRIRGGEVAFLAYKGYEQSLVSQLVDELKRALTRRTEQHGIDSYI